MGPRARQPLLMASDRGFARAAWPPPACACTSAGTAVIANSTASGETARILEFIFILPVLRIRKLIPGYITGLAFQDVDRAVVVDDEAVFVTSANLTEAALDRNIEVGLLVRDRALALTLSSHFRGLIDRGLLRPLPMA